MHSSKCSRCIKDDARIDCNDCGVAYCSQCFAKRHSRGTFVFHVKSERRKGLDCAECDAELFVDGKRCK